MAYSVNRGRGCRSEKWDSAENSLLLELIKNKISVIEDKDISSVSCEKKNAAWREVHSEFSAVTGSNRDVLRLKEKWKRLKLHARKRISRYYKLQQKAEESEGACGMKFSGADDSEIGEPTALDWEVKNIITGPFAKSPDLVIEPRNLEQTVSITPDIVQPTICHGETSVRIIGMSSTPFSNASCSEETERLNKQEEEIEGAAPLQTNEVTSPEKLFQSARYNSKRLHQFPIDAYRRTIEREIACQEEDHKMHIKNSNEKHQLQMEICKRELLFWDEKRNNQKELHMLQLRILKEQLAYWQEKRKNCCNDEEDDVVIKKEVHDGMFP